MNTDKLKDLLAARDKVKSKLSSLGFVSSMSDEEYKRRVQLYLHEEDEIEKQMFALLKPDEPRQDTVYVVYAYCPRCDHEFEFAVTWEQLKQ